MRDFPILTLFVGCAGFTWGLSVNIGFTYLGFTHVGVSLFGAQDVVEELLNQGANPVKTTTASRPASGKQQLLCRFPFKLDCFACFAKKATEFTCFVCTRFRFSAFTCIFSTPTAFSVFNDTLAAPRGPFEAGFGLGTSALQLASGQGHSAVLRRLVAVLTARCLLNFARKRDTTSFWVPVFWDRNSEVLDILLGPSFLFFLSENQSLNELMHPILLPARL